MVAINQHRDKNTPSTLAPQATTENPKSDLLHFHTKQ